MSKGQQRGNREQKKPKQQKKATALPSSSIVAQAKAPAPVPGKKR